jgi:phospholipid/cholesterol/gamma-HCH transport system substrate-binding protein
VTQGGFSPVTSGGHPPPAGGGVPQRRPGRALVRRKSLAGPVIYSVIFIAVTAVVTAILGISIANSTVGATTSYKANFTDVTGLNVGSEVDVAGVRVGQVDSISVVNRNLAQVGFSIQAGRQLPASATAAINWKNLAGQQYIELAQGTGTPGQVLPPGGTIPQAQTTPALNLTELFNGFQPLFEGLSPNGMNQLATELIQVFQGQGATMDSLIANVGSLTTTLANKEKVIDEVIANLNSVLATVNSRGSELSDLVTTMSQLVAGLAADRKPIGDAISAMSSLTNATAGLLQPLRPPLQQDITQLGRLSTTLADSSPLLNTFLHNLPVKMTDIARLASYGSWVNFYMCSATVSGVTQLYGPVPTGIPVTQQRCKG